MRVFSFGALALWFVLTCGARAAPPLEAFGNLPDVQQVEISPDGKTLAFIVGTGARRQVQIRAADTFKLIAVTASDKLKIRDITWAGPNHLLMTQSQTAEVWGLSSPKSEYFMLADYDLRKKRWFALMADQDRAMNSIFGSPMHRVIKGKDVVFVTGMYFPAEQGIFALYEIDLDNHFSSRIIDGDEDTEGWLLNGDGVPFARTEYRESNGNWFLRLLKDGHGLTADPVTAPLDSPTVLGLDKDGTAVIVSQRDNGENVLKTVSLSDGAVATSPIDSGVDLIFDPKTRFTIGTVREDDERMTYTFFSPADAAAWAAVECAFPKHVLTLASWSADRSKIVVHAEGPTYGDGFYLIDMTTKPKQAKWIADEYAQIAPEDIAETKFIRYPAADGVSIPAYLTVPQGREAKKLPLIVLVHGGPEARDSPGFDWWAQALASRGYAVLQPQYRGSSGFDASLLEAGWGQWGHKMQTDVSDGVRALAKSGVIDPARVCITGASYGGYAALAGAVLDPSAYRCAVDISGISDLRRFLDYQLEKNNGEAGEGMRIWLRRMGAKKPDDRYLDSISPARHADQAAMPILLIHGKDDTVVPYDQSQLMADALTRAHKPFELVTLNHEDHWLSRSDTRLQMLQAMVKFLDAHNPADAVPGSASPGQKTASGF